MNMDSKKIMVAGASGLVGRAVVNRLAEAGYGEILKPASSELDLIRQEQVEDYFDTHRPEAVIVAAAKVGGIAANNAYRADFIYQNLMIEANVIHSAFQTGVEKLILLGSSCIYPKQARYPIREEELLASPLEFTNEPYAIAKIAGIKLCESYYRQHGCNFFSVMPTNLYGPHDNFDLETSHVIPALMRKFHEAKISNAPFVTIWGTGKPMREFMYVKDMADAIFFVSQNLNADDIYNRGISHINIGTSEEISISETARLISEIVGYQGNIEFDGSRPDGTMRKVMDVSRLHELGWRHSTGLRDGLAEVYGWYSQNYRPAVNGAVPALKHMKKP